jgi:hypothetical protein
MRNYWLKGISARIARSGIESGRAWAQTLVRTNQLDEVDLPADLLP